MSSTYLKNKTQHHTKSTNKNTSKHKTTKLHNKTIPKKHHIMRSENCKIQKYTNHTPVTKHNINKYQ